ncbi:hypothetical protein [Pseudomonas phage PA10]|uniref:Uncharacterized protein n=1 Tax=Pseudomonas phage PA10 TaxID=1913575 RepID=A0A1J0MIY9_9CAUD|nr:hypothetical protein FDH20_gp083 [Pseudomonas phage PA10]APD20882.1 hypothetical protein [Pseudomonas phage PA10]
MYRLIPMTILYNQRDNSVAKLFSHVNVWCYLSLPGTSIGYDNRI